VNVNSKQSYRSGPEKRVFPRMLTTNTHLAHSVRAGAFRRANRSVPFTSKFPTFSTAIPSASSTKCRTDLSSPRTFIRSFHASPLVSDFHFDTHHFVQRLEREGLNRAQAEGIMSAMAEVIDESIRNMTSNMVTKADQEKVSARPLKLDMDFECERTDSADPLAPIHPAGRLCAAQV